MRVLAVVAAATIALCPVAAATESQAVTSRATSAAETTSAAVGAADDEQGKLLLMLDASGSMKAKDPSGLTKIEAAKKALTGVVGALPDTAQVGLRVYGATVDGKGKPTPAACADTRLVAPIAPLDEARLTTTISAIKALGETPIAHSLEESMKDLGADGKRNIVLVSDGEESCVPDPCPVVKKLTANGINLQIDTVGFGVDAKARQQLQCIADAGNGTYYDAKDAASLTTSLTKLSQRALRPFTVSGTPVVGTPAADGAPEIAAGQYTDTLTTGEGRRHYTLRRTIPGSTLRVAVTLRPSYSDTDSDEVVRIRLQAGDAMCESSQAMRIGASRFAALVTGTVRLPGAKTPGQGALTACESSNTVTFSLDREKGSPLPSPVEILVMEEPPVDDVEALPAPDDTRPQQTAPAPQSPRPVVGGVSFSSAPKIEPGSWSETFVPGETIFYRVPVGWGQRLRLSVVPLRGSVTEGASRLIHFEPVLYAPDRHVLSGIDLSKGTFGRDVPTQQAGFETRYRNREPVQSRSADLAGDHYISIAVPFSATGDAVTVPMTFNVTVEGTPSGEPAYAGTAPDAPTSPSASPSDAPSPGAARADPVATDPPDDGGLGLVAWLGLGAVVLLGAVGTAYAIVRTRARARGHGQPPATGV